MAVNIIRKHEGIHGTNMIEHHRNPSGQHNKVKWLLEQSHRDINKIHELVSNISMSGYDMISSWIIAECMAIDIVKHGFIDRHDYVTYLRSNMSSKIKELIAIDESNLIPGKSYLIKYNLLGIESLHSTGISIGTYNEECIGNPLYSNYFIVPGIDRKITLAEVESIYETSSL